MQDKKFELMLMRHAKYSIPMLMCSCFHKRPANIRKIATFTGVSFFDILVRRFP